MTESITNLKTGLKAAEDISQKSLEGTFLQLQENVASLYQSLVPSKRVKLEKRGSVVQDGIEGFFFFFFFFFFFYRGHSITNQ